MVGAGLSPATPDGGGASAAALALAGNHKEVLRLLQKSCPGVPLKAHGKGGSGSRHNRYLAESSSISTVDSLVLGLSTSSDRSNSRRRRDRRAGGGGNQKETQQRVSIGAEGGSAVRGRGGGRGARGTEEAGHRLLKAARIGDTVAMSEVLARGEVGVEWVGKNNGWTACMEAAEHGSLEGVRYLADVG